MVAQLRAAEKVFKVGEKFFKTNSKSIMNFIRGKGYKPLTKAQAAANLSKSKKLTKKLASKFDDKGVPQVPTSAITRTASKVKPKPKLTKDQMVRAVSKKPRPRLPKDQIPKPPSGNVPAVRTSSPKASSPTKEYLKKQGFKKSSGNVPANRTGSSVTAPKKMKLGGLKKKVRLRDTIVPLTVATIGASQLGGGPKSIESKTVENNRRKSTAKTNNVLNKKRDKDNRLSPGALGGKLKTPDYTPSRGIPKSTAKSLPAYFNNPIFKKEIKERGGREKFEPDTTSGKMSRFGRIGNDSTNKIMAETVYKTLDKNDNRTAGEDKLYNELYSVVMKRKGGKVSKKKGGMVKRSYGGKVKRNMGGMVSPRKKAVFRRGGGKALRGFGNATYSNKMY